MGGFIHVPYIPQQVIDKKNQPALSIDDIAIALTAGMAAIVEYRNKPDEHSVGGALRGCGLVVAVPEGRRTRYELADFRLPHALGDLLGLVLAVDPAACTDAADKDCC